MNDKNRKSSVDTSSQGKKNTKKNTKKIPEHTLNRTYTLLEDCSPGTSKDKIDSTPPVLEGNVVDLLTPGTSKDKIDSTPPDLEGNLIDLLTPGTSKDKIDSTPLDLEANLIDLIASLTLSEVDDKKKSTAEEKLAEVLESANALVKTISKRDDVDPNTAIMARQLLSSVMELKDLLSTNTRTRNEENEEKLKANAELIEMKKNYEDEIIRLDATIKKLELKNSSLQSVVDQRNKDCEELASICDELLAKVERKN